MGHDTDATNTVHSAIAVKGIYDHRVPQEMLLLCPQKTTRTKDLCQVVTKKLKGFSLSIVSISGLAPDNAVETEDNGAGLYCNRRESNHRPTFMSEEASLQNTTTKCMHKILKD